MTTLDERARRGAEIRARFGGGTPSGGSVPGSREMAPDLHRIADEALFGPIWQRPGLKIEHREMIVLSVLTVLQWENQLRRHVANAVNLEGSISALLQVKGWPKNPRSRATGTDRLLGLLKHRRQSIREYNPDLICQAVWYLL